MHRSAPKRSGIPAIWLCIATFVGSPCAWGQAPPEPKRAEYAFRWEASAGGPTSATDVMQMLGRTLKKTSTYEVTYFTFDAPADTPAGFHAILRQRIKNGETYELTYKLRGDRALPPDWACPPPWTKPKPEVDVSVTSKDDAKKVFSYSCTLKSEAGALVPPEELHAAKNCSTTMIRFESLDELKVEEWAFPSAKLLEVSRDGDNTEAALAHFRKNVADVLIDAGAKPTDRSKTDLGSDCR